MFQGSPEKKVSESVVNAAFPTPIDNSPERIKEAVNKGKEVGTAILKLWNEGKKTNRNGADVKYVEKNGLTFYMRSQWACDVWVEGAKQVTFSVVENIVSLEESEWDGSKKRLIFEHNGNNGKYKGNAKAYVDSAKLFIDAANS